MKYVALLRGINVGGKHALSMSELKNHFESIGLANVATYKNSGNIIFESDTIRTSNQVQKEISEVAGFTVPTVVLTANQIIRIAAAIPDGWQNDTQQKSDVLYLFPEVDDANSVLKLGYNSDFETALYVPGAVLWNVNRTAQSRSGLKKLLATPLYKKVTIRNVNTARALANLVR
ncbi:MAG: hypothetical protein QG629_815 [Patescibacteria group bacterium]|nr:hypothetical protein [Patescibacteria group bacterium]